MEPDIEDGEFHDVGDAVNCGDDDLGDGGSDTDTADEAEFADALDDILIQSGLEPVSREKHTDCKSKSSAESQQSQDQCTGPGDNLSEVEKELDSLKLEIEQLNSNTDSSTFLSKNRTSSETSDTPLTACETLADRLNQEQTKSGSEFDADGFDTITRSSNPTAYPQCLDKRGLW